MDNTDPNKPDELFDAAYGQRAIRSWSTLLVSALERASPGAILLLVYFLIAISLHLFADVPLHDDWTYAWSVEHFLKTGKLAVLDWSIHYPFAQILWGALFCLPFGLSFSALRVSTVMLASAWGPSALQHATRAGTRAHRESYRNSRPYCQSRILSSQLFLHDGCSVRKRFQHRIFFHCARILEKEAIGPMVRLCLWSSWLFHTTDCHCHTRGRARLRHLHAIF